MKTWTAAVGGLFLAVVSGAPEQARGRLETVSIESLEGQPVVVTAMFNPKELSVDKSVPWQTHPDSTEELPVAQYPGPEPTRLRLQLMFEDPSDVRKPLAVLEGLVREDPQLHRPPKVTVVWGGALSSGLPKFAGVIESVSQKYTLFLADGTPVRATAGVSMRAAAEVLAASSDPHGDSARTRSSLSTIAMPRP
jgi:hypothetical protein